MQVIHRTLQLAFISLMGGFFRHISGILQTH